jgi:hypothetical protein
MNILVAFFDRQPELVAELASGETAPFHHVLRRLDREPELVDVIRVALDDPFVAERLDFSYLGVLDEGDWERSLDVAADYDEVDAPEWVAFVPGRGATGLLLPDDSTPIERVSLFGEIDGVLRRVSLDLVRNSPLGISFSTSTGHCGLPVRTGTALSCAPGLCNGCRLRNRPSRGGQVCWCGHP